MIGLCCHPRWQEVATSLTQEQVQCIEMEAWDIAGCWGKCQLCRKWVMGEDHFLSKDHIRRAHVQAMCFIHNICLVVAPLDRCTAVGV